MAPTSVPGVYKRGSRYVVRYRDPHGKLLRRSVATLQEGRRLRASLVSDVARGDYRQLSRIRFEEYAREWIEGYAGRTSRGFRESTRDGYRRDLEKAAIPFLGRLRLCEIEQRDLKRFTVSLAEQGYATATIRRLVAPVRALLATALEEGLIRSNPAAGLRVAAQAGARTAEERAKTLTEPELHAFLAELPPGWRDFHEFLAHTGLRIGEAIGLQWADIDLGRRRVHVRRAISGKQIGLPKSRYGLRAIPLTPRMAQTLWQLRKESAYPGDDDYVFTGKSGRHLDTSNIAQRVFKPAAARAGVRWASFHTLRHTCATMLFRHGYNVKQVQVWLGHHSPAFTMSVYVHLLPDDLPAPDFLDALTRQDGQAKTQPGGTRTELAVASARLAP